MPGGTWSNFISGARGDLVNFFSGARGEGRVNFFSGARGEGRVNFVLLLNSMKKFWWRGNFFGNVFL